MDSPRGRILLMRIGHEEGETISPEMVTHFDRCLGCMACVTACPSGVQYDKLIERDAAADRAHARRARGSERRLPARRSSRCSPTPARLRALVPGSQARRRSSRRWCPTARLQSMLSLAPPAPPRPPCRRLPQGQDVQGAGASAGPSRSCRAASSACSSATSTRPPCACCAPRAGRSTRRARRAAAARCSCTRASRTRRSSWRAATIAAYEGFDRDRRQRRRLRLGDEGLRPPASTTEWAERAEAFSAKVVDVHELLAERRAAGRAPSDRRCAPPTTTPATSRTPRASAPSRASCCAASPGWSCSSPPSGSCAAARPASTTCSQPEAAAKLGARKADEPARHRRRGDRRRQPGLRAADRRAPGRCPIYHPMTLLDHVDPRSRSREQLQARPAARRAARRDPVRRRARLRRRAARPLRRRAAPSCCRRARERGAPSGFLEETREIREGDWQVPPPRPDYEDRRVEITGPTDRKLVINALN